MQTATWRKGSITSVTLLIALVVAALLVGTRNDNAGGDDGSEDPPSTTTTTTNPEDPNPEDPGVPDGDREVAPGDVIPEEAKCESNVFITNSLPSTDKTWSTSVSTPYESSDPDEIFAELLVENCGNPTLAESYIQMFYHVQSVWLANPWMNDFIQLANQKGLRAAFLTKDPGEEGVFVTPEFTEYAEMVNTILLDYKVLGIEEWMSVQNWYLPLGSTTAGELPRVSLNPDQEGLPALILVFTDKGKVCPDPTDVGAFIGSNVGDKRPELFEAPVCEPPAEPPCTTGCGGGNTTTTTTVGRKGTPATTTPPPPVTPPGATTATSLPPGQTGGGDSGVGAPPPSTTVAPTPTVAPPGSIPATSQPPVPGTTIVGP